MVTSKWSIQFPHLHRPSWFKTTTSFHLLAVVPIQREILRVPRPTEPASAPPERPSKVRTIDPCDRLSPRPISPDPASGRRSHIPIVVRPPTTLCMCIVSQIPSVILTISQVRPKPFWRNATRSAVAGTFYASSHHLIRRSTFIAAGLRFDKPVADLSALGVESRVGIVVLLPDSIP